MTRIVIADDDPTIRQIIDTKLSSAGYEVVSVETGTAAVEACVAARPDLVMLDVMMPEMSGLDAARALREDPKMDGLPIIMLTAKSSETDIAEGFEAGADDYIIKPFSPRHLASLVSGVLARNN